MWYVLNFEGDRDSVSPGDVNVPICDYHTGEVKKVTWGYIDSHHENMMFMSEAIMFSGVRIWHLDKSVFKNFLDDGWCKIYRHGVTVNKNGREIAKFDLENHICNLIVNCEIIAQHKYYREKLPAQKLHLPTLQWFMKLGSYTILHFALPYKSSLIESKEWIRLFFDKKMEFVGTWVNAEHIHEEKPIPPFLKTMFLLEFNESSKGGN